MMTVKEFAPGKHFCGPTQIEIEEVELARQLQEIEKMEEIYIYREEDEIPEGVEFWEDIATTIPQVGECRKCGCPVFENDPVIRGSRYCPECGEWAQEMCYIDDEEYGFSVGRGIE